MAQAITNYTAFFTGAKEAVKKLEELKQKERELEDKEKKLERSLKTEQKMAADAVAATVKQREEEITGSYDAEIDKARERLKKVRQKREKAKSQGIKERIEEDTSSLVRENKEIKGQMKTLFQANHVPGYCRSGFYYALYFTRGLREAGVLMLMLLVCFLAVPCGVYFLIPNRNSFYLFGIYLAAILLFGGIYVMIGNRTKMRHMEVLKEGRVLRNRIRENERKIRAIARTIRKDKNESSYNLEKFDDEIAQLDQDISQIVRKKNEALNTFETVTKSIISDEIFGNRKKELDRLAEELENAGNELKLVQGQIKEQCLTAADEYGIYVGKDFLTVERLEALEKLIAGGNAANICEAITVYKSRTYQRAEGMGVTGAIEGPAQDAPMERGPGGEI